MLFTAGLLSLVAAASAQQVVTVGFTASDPGGIFQFKPNNFNATNGTTITFQFTGAPGNHSVTQSLFADPCNPAAGGFDSGWVFIPSTPSPVPEFNITITNDSKPIWFFCKQLLPSPHCGAGMVGAINAPASGNTFATFLKNAQSLGQKGSGQSQGGLVGIGASASAGIGPIPSGATAYTGPIASATGSGAGAGSSGGAQPSNTAPPSGGASPTSPSSASKGVVASSLLGLSAAALAFFMA